MKEAVRSEKCEVLKTLLRLSLKKKLLVEGRTRSGQVFLRTIGHLFLGNFRRRLARVYVISALFDIRRFPRKWGIPKSQGFQY